MASAQDLISQAEQAQNEEQLREVEQQAEGRTTVEDAVRARRAQLRQEQRQGQQGGQGQPSQGTARSAPRPENWAGTDQPAEAQQSGGAVRQTEEVESADPAERLPDALGNMPMRQSELARRQAEEPRDVMPGGVLVPPQGEIAGGNIAKVLRSPDESELVQSPMAKEQAALQSPIGQKIAGFVGRPVSEWGVLASGDTVRGHGLLLDLNTGEKVRVLDGHRIQAGGLYLNLRQVPQALAQGDTIERVLGAS